MTTSPVTVAVIGPGAIGGVIAAWLTRSPRVASVILCARSPLDRLEVTTPDGDLIEADPRIVTDPSGIQGPVDWVLVATKAYDVQAAATWLKPLMGPETRLAVLQNGVEHVERFKPHAPAEHILPVVVDIPAERSAPGRIRQRRTGDLTVPAGRAGEDFVALFVDSIIEARTTEDFTTAAWTKLALNCAGAVNALTGRPGGVVAAEGVADVMRALVAECVAVGRAVGADLAVDLPDQIVARTEASPADAVNSILGDRLAERPMEWDARNGVIARLGRVHGIETPVNALCSTLLSATAWRP